MSTEPGMTIEDIVFRLVEDMLGVRKVTLESTLIDDLGADELDLTELTLALEERLDVRIPDYVMEQFRTVGDIVDFVQSHTGE
ncbi:acyl carrier protein-like protein [Aspergillus insuetus]